jgi:hypothetical protein
VGGWTRAGAGVGQQGVTPETGGRRRHGGVRCEQTGLRSLRLRMARAAGARAIAAAWGYVPADRLAAEAPDLVASTPAEAAAAALGGSTLQRTAT